MLCQRGTQFERCPTQHYLSWAVCACPLFAFGEQDPFSGQVWSCLLNGLLPWVHGIDVAVYQCHSASGCCGRPEQMTAEVPQRTGMASPAWGGTRPLGLPWLAVACPWRGCCFAAWGSPLQVSGGKRQLCPLFTSPITIPLQRCPWLPTPRCRAPSCRCSQHHFCISGMGSPAPSCSSKALHLGLVMLLLWSKMIFQQVWVLQ